MHSSISIKDMNTEFTDPSSNKFQQVENTGEKLLTPWQPGAYRLLVLQIFYKHWEALGQDEKW